MTPTCSWWFWKIWSIYSDRWEAAALCVSTHFTRAGLPVPENSVMHWRTMFNPTSQLLPLLQPLITTTMRQLCYCFTQPQFVQSQGRGKMCSEFKNTPFWGSQSCLTSVAPAHASLCPVKQEGMSDFWTLRGWVSSSFLLNTSTPTSLRPQHELSSFPTSTFIPLNAAAAVIWSI